MFLLNFALMFLQLCKIYSLTKQTFCNFSFNQHYQSVLLLFQISIVSLTFSGYNYTLFTSHGCSINFQSIPWAYSYDDRPLASRCINITFKFSSLTIGYCCSETAENRQIRGLITVFIQLWYLVLAVSLRCCFLIDFLINCFRHPYYLNLHKDKNWLIFNIRMHFF